MKSLVVKLGAIFAILGFILCAFAGGVRLMGLFHVFNYEAITLLQAGTALMVAACVIRLYVCDQQ